MTCDTCLRGISPGLEEKGENHKKRWTNFVCKNFNNKMDLEKNLQQMERCIHVLT